MKKILFVCVENSCRSQIAEGLANYYGAGVLKAYSAGSNPSGIVNLNAIGVMREIGIDISLQISKGFVDLPIKKFDYVITLGCNDVCPYFPAEQHIEWAIEDPKNKDEIFFRKIRDGLKNKVVNLINELSETKKEGPLNGKAL